MFGAVITEPTSNDADMGVIFIENAGYLDMCGHGSIGLVTVLLATGLLEKDKQENSDNQEVILDTPAGKINTRAKIEDGEVKSVTIRNVPAFFHASVAIELKGLGRVPVDIAYGGNLFGLVNAKYLDLRIKPENAAKLAQRSLSIREMLNQKTGDHLPKVNGKKMNIKLIEIYEESSPPRNVVVFGPGQIDRSPCGTGTSAKMAVLYERNKLKIGESYPYRSIIDTEFIGKIVEEVKIGKRKAIVPEITGSAYVTGFHQFVIDKNDPLKYGISAFM